MIRFPLTIGVLLSAFACPSFAQTTLQFPQGVATGDVTPSSAILWTRTDRAAPLRLDVSESETFSDPLELRVETSAETDFTVQVTLGDLSPATTYYFRFTQVDGESWAEGSFTTAPDPHADTLVRFLVAGDVGGQGYCRHVELGYPGFKPMAELRADFFVANGDMIYADNGCPENGPEGWPNIPGDFPAIVQADWAAPGVAREALLGHWRYNRADPHQQALLAATPIYTQWDDHEVINDFGAAWPEWPGDPARPGYGHLVDSGREALFLFNPMTRSTDEPGRIYRSFRWGRHLELFLLDARSYRSGNEVVDKPSNAKTMLGAEQLQWLKDSVTASDATWKVVSSDVPLSIPTGSEPNIWGRGLFCQWRKSEFFPTHGFPSMSYWTSWPFSTARTSAT